MPAAFDIETSSFMLDDKKCAAMYVWQFGILNWVTYGRTWDEFIKFISVLSTVLGLSKNLRLVVYIHNMGYEFQFMRKHITWDKLFFLDDRKPVYGISGGYEFRCSWKLSAKSLDNMSKDLQKYHVKKMVGDLDYRMVRTSATPLTEKEWAYCENDVRLLLAYIQEKIENDGDITRIPLTNTGYVRNYCRKACFKRYKDYRNLMSELTLDPDEYSQLKRAFAGGFVHASAKYSGRKLSHVGSFDFTSSYPYVMVSEQFPMSRAKLLTNVKDTDLEYYLTRYCCLIDITFNELIPKVYYDRPLSESKLDKERSCGIVADNGRIVCAIRATTTITEQDFFVLREFYEWESIEIHEMRIYEKGYLPTNLVKAILKFYVDKTKLKGIQEEVINYMISKNMLNAAYGMMVTDIIREIIDYQDDRYSSTEPDINEAITKYNNGVKRFLFYPWGVWVTSYARANLFSGILACKNDYVYSDTDSIKILHPERHVKYIEAYNKVVIQKLERAANFHKIPMEQFSPLNRKGEAKTIGLWDFEGVYDRFKTIGAKRYMVEKDGEYSLTVSGVNKEKACKYIVDNWEDPLDGLSDELVIPADYSGRLISTYVDEPVHGIVTDYLGQVSEFNELSYIHMEPSDYTLTLSKDYKGFLKFLQGLKEVSW